MEDSILNSTKKALGIQKDLKAFDQDILMSINSVFSILYQIGVISSTGTYRIEDDTTTWDELFDKDPVVLDLIKTYTYARVRILFDPPTNSFLLDSLKAQAQELEWRIYIQSDNGEMSNNVSKSSVSFEKVNSLPESGDPSVVYLVPNGGEDSNIYDEYYWVEDDSRFELFGTIGMEAVTSEKIESEYEKYVKPYLNKEITIKTGDNDD